MADRVTGDQTDNAVCRTLAYYASPTTNCCGCPEDVFVVLRFSCPSFSPLVVLCFLVLFCFACHISGAARHLKFFYFIFFSLIFSVLSLSHLDCLLAFVCRPCRTQYSVTSFHCLLCLLRQYVASLSWFCDHRDCISRSKNRHGHWMCWTGRKNGLM